MYIINIISRFLLAGDKFMPKMHLSQPGFTYSFCGRSQILKTNRNSKKQEMLDISIAMNQTRHVFIMIQLMIQLIGIQVCLEEGLVTKYCVTNHLQLLVIHRMTDITVGLHQWSTDSLIINSEMILPMREQEQLQKQAKEILKITNQQMSYTEPSLENLVYLSYRENIQGGYLADMKLMSKHTSRVRFLLCY